MKENEDFNFHPNNFKIIVIFPIFDVRFNIYLFFKIILRIELSHFNTLGSFKKREVFGIIKNKCNNDFKIFKSIFINFQILCRMKFKKFSFY